MAAWPDLVDEYDWFRPPVLLFATPSEADPWFDDVLPPTPPSSPLPQDVMPSAGPRGRAWCFTLNNPDVTADQQLDAFRGNSSVKYAVFQLEEGENGTRHFQGYVEFSQVKTLTAVKALVPRAHFELRKGSSEQARDYCMKSDSRVDGPWEFGEFKPSSSGKRSDLQSARDAILAGGKTKRDILDEFPEVLAKYPRFVDTCFAEYVRSTVNPIADFDPRPWQSRVLDMVKADPDPRGVLWVYDAAGNTGKTYLAKYLVQEFGAFYCNGGKGTDILYAYNGEPICIFDYVRDAQEYINYGPIEQIKNGIVYSSKYESRMKVFKVPHVVIFANFLPDQSKMSADRWNIIELKADGDWIIHD